MKSLLVKTISRGMGTYHEHSNKLNKTDISSLTPTLSILISSPPQEQTTIKWRVDFRLSGISMIEFHTEDIYQLTEVNQSSLKSDTEKLLNESFNVLKDCIVAYRENYFFAPELVSLLNTSYILEEHHLLMESYLKELIQN